MRRKTGQTMKSLNRLLIIFVIVGYSYADSTVTDQLQALVDKTKKTPAKLLLFDEKKSRSLGKKKIIFSFKEKDLSEIIEEMAAFKEINIVLPQGKDALKGKLTFQYDKKITMDEAWNVLLSILEGAGISILPHGSMYIAMMRDKSAGAPTSLFINTYLENLPSSDERIRYIYYFSNISLADKTQAEDVKKIIEDMLPEVDKKEGYVLDESLNSLMISSTSSRIKMIMKIIGTLDESGFRESVEVINLQYIDASFIEKLFAGDKNAKINGLIPSKAEDNRYPWMQPEKKPAQRKRYFSENTRVVALKNNTIVIFGKQDAIDRVRDFIHKYIDVPLGAGESIVHIYDLQFLDAKSVYDSLGKLLQVGGTKTQVKGAMEIGQEYDFSKVILQYEEPHVEKTAEQEIAGEAKVDKDAELQGAYLGGNRLVVAARDREWRVIKDLIDKLDYAEQQVALEALIIDITMDDARALGAQIRNKLFNGVVSHDVNFQSAQLDNMWLNFDGSDQIKSPPGLAADLLSTEKNSNIRPSSSSTDTTNIPQDLAPQKEGETVVSFSETQNGKEVVWGILQMLNDYSNTQILSQPFVVAANNKKATLVSAQLRWLQGEATAISNGPAMIKREDVDAGLSVVIQPRVSDSDDISLSITIDVNEYTSTTDNTRRKRHVQTNAVVKDGQVLMLGGLDKIDEKESRLETPMLGRIPLLGWFFKKKQRQRTKQTLMVFIVPRIIRPFYGKLPSNYISSYSRSKLDCANEDLDDTGYTYGNRDPISRSFFKSISADAKGEIDNFVESTRWQSAKTKMAKLKKAKRSSKRQRAAMKNDHAESTLTPDNSQAQELKKRMANLSNPLLR